MKTFREDWERFQETCVHPERRGKNEVENMRRVFYAGGCCMLQKLEMVDLTKQDAVKDVVALCKEMNEFYNSMGEGHE